MAIQNINSIVPLKPNSPTTVEKTPGESLKSFASFLGDAVENLNQQQQLSDQASKKIAAGDVQDLHKALIIQQQASITLDFAVEVRNKAIDAYQEIMRMSI